MELMKFIIGASVLIGIMKFFEWASIRIARRFNWNPKITIWVGAFLLFIISSLLWGFTNCAQKVSEITGISLELQ